MKRKLAYLMVSYALLFSKSADAQDNIARRWTPDAISTSEYESSPTFTPDGREIYFVSADTAFRNYRILFTRCEPNGWSHPRPAPFSAPEPVIEADPYVTPAGDRIYFLSARHDPRNEDFDIWTAARLADGEWGPAERLPYPVNTGSTELLPRMMDDGRLVFGSDRPGGFGQGDIYFATQKSDGYWQVENAGAPVSTADHEYEADLSRDGRTLVVVANRGVKSHLYRFENVDGEWREVGRLAGRDDVFQVGPLLSPDGESLLFAEAVDGRSGEIMLTELEAGGSANWPPSCPPH